jgi:N-acetylneuraminic acid mutarotase
MESCDIYVFDPQTKTLSKYETNAKDKPKPRRRHSSIIIGNSLLIYGGYDGKYLNNFDYLPLQTTA